MRLVPILVAVGIALTGCDQLPTPILASTAPTSGTPVTTPLAIVPSQAQLVLGTTMQLTTNASAALQSQLQWQSFQPAIAAVTPAGVVTALSAGTAVVQARFAFDTTQAATATITVVGPPAPASVDTVPTGGTTGG